MHIEMCMLQQTPLPLQEVRQDTALPIDIMHQQLAYLCKFQLHAPCSFSKADAPGLPMQHNARQR